MLARKIAGVGPRVAAACVRGLASGAGRLFEGAQSFSRSDLSQAVESAFFWDSADSAAATGVSAGLWSALGGGDDAESLPVDRFDEFANAPPSSPQHIVARRLAAHVGLHRWRKVAEGKPQTTEFRLRYEDAATGITISPWHDIPFHNEDGTVNMVVEIPRYTRDKMEIATDEPFNPIKQDLKKGQLRQYKWGDMPFNYGAVPQTWEDPEQLDEATQKPGDDDPVDVIDVGTCAHAFGSVVRVKVLGALAMIDDGEADWKVVAVSATDPVADFVHSVEDLELVQPTVLHAFRQWMRLYKTVDGKPENSFAFDEQYVDAQAAMKVLEHTHQQWQARDA